MTTAKKMAKTTTILMIITFASKIFGFLRETVIAYYFGGGIEAEAYFMALSIPSLIFTSVGTSISTTFIPLYTHLFTRDGRDGANRFANNILNIIIVICCILLVLGIAFSPQLVRILAPGFSGQLYNLTVQLARILFIGAIFNMISSVMSGILQSNERFYGTALSGFPYNLAIILGCVIFSGKYGAYALAIATIIGTILKPVVQSYFLKGKYDYEPVLDFKDPYVKRLVILIVPVIIGTAIRQVNTVVDKALASSLELGSIAAINYSDRLVGFVDGIFTSTVLVVIYPFFSQLTAKEDYDDLNTYIASAVNIFAMLMIPITIITMIYSRDIVSIVFQRGEFGARDVELTAFSLTFLALGFLPFAIRQIFNRAFYALQDTKKSMINGAVSVTTNIIANFMLVRSLKVGGLSLATSLSYVASVIFFVITWMRTMDCSINDIFDFKGMGKLLISSIVFAALIWFMSVKGVHLFIATAIGGIAYLGMLWIIGVKELEILSSYFVERFSGNR